MTSQARQTTLHSSKWPVRRLWRRGPLEFALILVVFFIVGGAPAPHVNETHYLAKAKHYWNPLYCPGDFFLDSADPHLTFYWAFGWVTRFASLPVVAWIGRIAAWLLIAAGWLRLSRSIAPAPWAAALSATMWLALVERGNFAGEWVVGGVEAKCFAYGLLLLGLAAMACGRWTTTWIWLGAASAFHVLVGAWAVLAAFGAWLSEPRPRTPLLKMLPGLTLGGLLSLPGLLPALMLERNVDPVTAVEAARIYVFDRLPHHLAPLALPPNELTIRLARFGITAAVMVGLWAWATKQSQAADGNSPHLSTPVNWRALMRVMRFAGFALAGSGAGLLLEAGLTSDPSTAARILRYYWFRQADVAVPLAAALGGTCFILALVDQRTSRRAGTAAALIPLALCGWFLLSTAVLRLRNPEPPAAAKLDDFAAWRDACNWIDEHAPRDARFLIPRAGHSFKWYASRADVVNYKDVPQDAASVVEWRRRMGEVFPRQEAGGVWMTLDSPEKLGTHRVRALARRYGASHVIARSDQPLDLPVLYPTTGSATDSYYTVYATGEPTGRPRHEPVALGGF